MKSKSSSTFEITLATVFLIVFSTSIVYADAQRGTLVSEESIHVAPGADSAKLGIAGRGNELVILETTRDWIHAEVILNPPRRDEGATEEEQEGKIITGWVAAKAVVTSTTQDGGRIRGPGQPPPRAARCGAGRDAALLPLVRFDACFPAGRRSALPGGRYSL